MAIDLNTSLPASARGWGSGWPNGQTSKMVPLVFRGKIGDVSLPSGCRSEVLDLVQHLLTETEARGYLIHPGWCWGYADRAIKGIYPLVASNHSWGIAFDINAPTNPLGGLHGDMPGWMGDLWNEYGFRWGGDYSNRKDWMHYEFMGTVAEAKLMTQKARDQLVTLTAEQAQELDWVKGYQMYMRGDPEPKKQGPVKRGWNDAKVSVEGRPPAH